MATHDLLRTSPKGQPFVGMCPKCGAQNLTFADMKKDCPNPGNLSQGDVLGIAIGHRQ